VTHLVSCPLTSDGSTAISGCYKNPVERYNLININSKSITCKKLNEINDNTFGNNFVTINPNTGNVATTKTDSSKAIKKVFIQNSGDDTTSSLKNQLTENTRVLTCGFSSVDLDMLSPNKQFMLTIENSENKKYNGNYRLTRTVATFVKEGSFYNPVITCSLKG
jgi:hypothetical protein